MAYDESLDDFVSPKAFQQFADLHIAAQLAVDDMVELTTTAKGAFDGLNIAKTLADVTTGSKTVNEANKSMAEGAKVYADSMSQADAILSKYNGHSLEFVKVLKDVEIARKTSTQTIILETKEHERLEQARIREENRLLKAKEAYAQLNQQYKDAAANAKNLAAAYLKMEESAATMDETQKVAFSELEAQMKAAQATAIGLQKALLKIDQAVGQSQRNVGNYPTVAAEVNALKEQMIGFELAVKASNEQLAVLAERKAALQRGSIGFQSGSQPGNEGPARYTDLVGRNPIGFKTAAALEELKQIDIEMEAIKGKTIEDQEQFEKLAIRVSELKEAINSVNVAVTEVGEKAAASGERIKMAYEKVGEILKEIGRFAIAFFGIQAGMEFISGISEEFEKADGAARKLTNTLENNNAAPAMARINDQVKEITEEFKYLDDYEVQGVFDKLITYGKLSEKQIKELIPVIIDFAAKERISVEESSKVIIKSLEGNAKALKEYGINIKDAATEAGAAATPAERLSMIMKELKPRVEGAGAAFANSFGGKIESVKRDIKEMELSIADFFVKLSGVEEANQKAAVQASQEANAGQKLIDEYEELSKKVNQTADDKTRLGEITAKLGDIFGNSVLSIDAETGALQLNLEKTKELIKQRLLLANQAAAEQAAKYNAAKERAAMAQDEFEKDKKRYAQKGYKDLDFENPDFVNSRIPGGLPGADIALDAQNQWRKMEDEITKRKEALKKLEELGYEYNDVEKLFNPDVEIKPKGDLDKGPKKKAKDTTSEDLAAMLQSEKDFNDAVAEQAKQRYRNDADAQTLIFENEKASLAKRLEAYDQFTKDQIALAVIENGREIADLQAKQREIADKKKASDDGISVLTKTQYQALYEESLAYDLKVANAEEELQNKLASLTLVGKNKRLAIIKSSGEEYVKQENQGLQDRLADFEAMYGKERDQLDTAYENKLINAEKYEKKLKELKERYALIVLNEKIAEDQYLLKSDQITADQRAAIQARLNQEIDQRNGMTHAGTKTLEDAQKDLKSKEMDVANQAMSIGKSLVDDYYQSQLRYEEQLLKAIQTRAQISLDAINTSMMNDRQKAVATQALNAQTALQEKQIQDQMTRIKREQAIADRVAAVLGVTEQIAIAEVSALKLLGDPITAPLYPEMAALIAGAGAAQIAAILAAPMPQYLFGTPPEGHPGGKALVAEVRPETIIEPGKAPYVISEPTIKDFPAGTHVIPRVVPEIDLIAGSMGFMTSGLLNSLNIVNQNDFSALQITMKEEIGDLKDTIKNLPIHNHIMKGGEWQLSIKRGNSITTYINKHNA